jgi:hypothetical protein
MCDIFDISCAIYIFALCMHNCISMYEVYLHALLFIVFASVLILAL